MMPSELVLEYVSKVKQVALVVMMVRSLLMKPIATIIGQYVLTQGRHYVLSPFYR